MVLVGDEDQDAASALTRSPYVGLVAVPTRTAIPWFNPHRSWAVREPPIRVCGSGGRRGPGCDISTHAIALCGVSRGTNWRGRGLRRIGLGRFTNRPYVCEVIVGDAYQDSTSALTRSTYGWLVAVPIGEAVV